VDLLQAASYLQVKLSSFPAMCLAQ